MPATAVGKNEVFVGRIRKDLNNDKGFHLWVVSDNLLKRRCMEFCSNCRALSKITISVNG